MYGLRKRNGPPNKIMKHERAAGCAVVRETRQEPLFLLVRSRKGFWGIPKGRAKKGEHDIDAAIRELREETGISTFFVVSGFRTRFSYIHGDGEKRARKTVTAYLVKTYSVRAVISREHTAFRWVSYGKAMQMIAFPNARRPVSLAHRFLTTSRKTIALQEKVYTAVRRIPKGYVVSYADIARRCGSSPRTVAQILANNHDPRVPCHRAVSSSGAILGYNRGAKEKERLLRKEGVMVTHSRGRGSVIARSAYDRK